MLMSKLAGLREERGFSLIVALVVLSVATILLFSAIDAVLNGGQTTRNDLDQKRALLAADAGLSAYVQQLNANPNYWDTCAASGGATGATGAKVTVPGSNDNGSIESYTYQNVPATGSTGCDPNNAIASMIEAGSGPTAGTFRVKFTGSSAPSGASTATATRTIVAQFKPASFLQFIYFTIFEIEDPSATGDSQTACATYYWTAPSPATGNTRNANCGGAIDFITGDALNGPVHSNDDMFICGSPSFGSTGSTGVTDAVETPGFIGESSCTNSPRVNGVSPGSPTTTQAPTAVMPADDSQLEQVADGGNSSQMNGCYAGAGCVFTGPTQIQLTGNTFTVTNASYSGTKTGLSPSNGVIYIANTGNSLTCGVTYNPSSTDYTTNGGCGNASVAGNYTTSLTIGAANDVIIYGNITTTPGGTAAPTGTALLGLIANDFVRIAHPCTGGNNFTSGIYSVINNPIIDAAILAIDHSFIVDDYACGSSPGTITLWGTIAQNFRGVVGTHNGATITAGYNKNYNYDTRLQSLSPPYFLNPVGAGWEVNRVTECGNSGC
jgi:Tfp pilus assembly protein PilX